MDPIFLIGGLGAAYLLFRGRGGKAAPPKALDQGNAASFATWPPDEQGAAWYATISHTWTPTGPLGDNGGRVCQTYRGARATEGADAVRARNDASLRELMGQGYRIAVSRSVIGAASGEVPYLVTYPDGFSRASLPASWGDLRQLFAPPPGSLGSPAPNFGGSVDPLDGPDADPFSDMPEPARSQAREQYKSDTVSLLDLEETAKELDKAGYPRAAAAMRRRRDELRLSRSLAAKERGGWLYTVRSGDLPYKVAQWYGGVKPNVLRDLAAKNPEVSANNWAGWIVGRDVLLPGTWPDPSLKPLPPVAVGQAPKKGSPTSHGGGGGGGGTASQAFAERLRALQDPNDVGTASERLAEIMAGKASSTESADAWRARKIAELMANMPAPEPTIKDPWGASATTIDVGVTPSNLSIETEG